MRLFLGTILIILMAAGNIHAEMVAVSQNRADIRSSPSEVVSTVIMQVPRYYPLSTRESQHDFLKVTDYQGKSGWIEKSNVDKTRTVVINTAGRANIRSGPGKDNKIVFKAHEGVCFKVLAEKGGWLQIQHESGVKGWIYKGLVWGG